jgi:hypothetical protein
MNKTFGFLTLALLMVLSVGMVSAATTDTLVGGTIYKGTTYDGSNGIVGADVTVVCHHIGGDQTQTTASISGGAYSVNFDNTPGKLCSYGDSVTVSASWSGITGTKNGTVNMQYPLPSVTLNVGIVNIPMVPEFGIIAGGLTILSAMVVFFVIRRK